VTEPATSLPAVTLVDHYQIERFLYHEAGLLDRRAYPEWLALLTRDIIYRVSSRQVRDLTADPLDIVLTDENFAGLKSRLDQLGNPRLTHAENPPTLTRRFISNIETSNIETSNIETSHGVSADSFLVRANILVHRSRPDEDTGRLLAGSRNDIIRRIDCLDHGLIHGGAITVIL
jgi:3-phenylpropionate/cinnamic acid dioxygenase small subunit